MIVKIDKHKIEHYEVEVSDDTFDFVSEAQSILRIYATEPKYTAQYLSFAIKEKE